MSAWLPKVVEPSKQQGLAAVFFLILYPYYLIRDFKLAQDVRAHFVKTRLLHQQRNVCLFFRVKKLLQVLL